MSKYLGAFQAVKAESELQLIGEFLLIELIKDEEFKTKSGLIIQSAPSQRQVNGLSADKPTFARILAVGEGYYDDSPPTGAVAGTYAVNEKNIPLDSKPGQIVLVATGSVKPFSIFGKLINYGEIELGLTRESDIQARFESEEAFNRYFERLNAALTQAAPKPLE